MSDNSCSRDCRIHSSFGWLMLTLLFSGCVPSTNFGFQKEDDSGIEDSTADSTADSSPDAERCPPPALEELVACDTFSPEPLLADEVLVGDMNGDGADDLLTWFDEGGCAFVSLANGAGGLSAPMLWLDLGARAQGSPELDRWPLYRELGDVNGDGTMDLIWGERCDSSAQWFVAPSDGGRFVFEIDEGKYPGPALGRLFWPLTKTLGEPDSSGYWVIRLGDISPPNDATFGVDGRADLIAVHVLPGDVVETNVYVSTGVDPALPAFLNDSATQPWANSPNRAPNAGVFVAELGAGSAACGYGWRALDVVGFRRHEGGEESWDATMAWGGLYPTAPLGGFDDHWEPWLTTPRTAGHVPSTDAFMADVTRDGGDDALWYIDAAAGGPAWVVGVSLRTTCGRVDYSVTESRRFDDPGRVLDVDSDGRLLETPVTFSEGALRRLVGDVNGDAVTDLIALDSAGEWQIKLLSPVCVALADAPSGARWALCRGRTSWEQASADCVTKGGALAHPTTAAEHLALSQALDAVTLDDTSLMAWIGLSDRVTEGSFAWEDGAILDPSMASYWSEGSPSAGASADCVFVDSLRRASDGSYQMLDIQCDSDTALGLTSAYVCELDR